MQIAADVFEGDKIGQLAAVGPFELTAAFAQLGRKDRQLQRGVHFLFRGAGDARFFVAFHATHAPFIDF